MVDRRAPLQKSDGLGNHLNCIQLPGPFDRINLTENILEAGPLFPILNEPAPMFEANTTYGTKKLTDCKGKKFI